MREAGVGDEVLRRAEAVYERTRLSSLTCPGTRDAVYQRNRGNPAGGGMCNSHVVTVQHFVWLSAFLMPK
jgi:hypothetical protein